MTDKHQLTVVSLVDAKLKQKLSFAEILAIVLISGQIILYSIMWFRLLGDPSLKKMDFVNFYEVGRIFRAGKYSQIYSFTSETQFQRQFFGDDNINPWGFNHPPYLVPIFSFVANDNYVLAYIYWSFLRLLVVFGCVRLIYLYFLCLGWSVRFAWLGAIGSVTYFPIYISLLGGQDTIFTMLGLLIWMFALLYKKEMSAGFGLAFATLTPTIAGALALPLFVSRRRAGLWFSVGVLGLSIYSLLLVKPQGIIGFLTSLQASSKDHSLGNNWVDMYNLLGLLMRAFPNLSVETIRSIVWISAFFSILVSCFFWWNKREHLTIKHIGIAIVLGTFTSPHLYLHGLSYLLLPLLGMETIFYYRGNKTIALVFIPVISTVLMIAFILMPGWSYALYYLLMFAMVFCFIVFKPSSISPIINGDSVSESQLV